MHKVSAPHLVQLALVFYCLLHSSFFYSMKPDLLAGILNDSLEQAQKQMPSSTINLLTFKSSLQNESLSAEKLIASNILLTPSRQELLIGLQGEVHVIGLSPSTGLEKNAHLYTHPHVQHAPLLAAALPSKDRHLIVASAGNYYSPATKCWLSNVIIHAIHSYSRQERSYGFPIQSIKISQTGDLIALGSQSQIILLNRKEETEDSKPFVPGICNDPLQDIAITPGEQNVLAITRNGTIQIFPIANNTLGTIPEVFCETVNLERIHFPSIEKGIAHVSETSKTSKDTTSHSIAIFNFLKIADADTSAVPFEMLQTIKSCEKIALNDGSYSASAHWTEKNDASSDDRHMIYVYYLNNTIPESETKIIRYVLKAPTEQNTYTILSHHGRLEHRNEHFLNVTFYENVVVALQSSGKLFVWKLPKTDINQAISYPVSPLTSSLSDSSSRIPSIELTKQPKHFTKLNKSAPSSPSGSLTSSSSSPSPKRPIKRRPGSSSKPPQRRITPRSPKTPSTSPSTATPETSPRGDER